MGSVKDRAASGHDPAGHTGREECTCKDIACFPVYVSAEETEDYYLRDEYY